MCAGTTLGGRPAGGSPLGARRTEPIRPFRATAFDPVEGAAIPSRLGLRLLHNQRSRINHALVQKGQPTFLEVSLRSIFGLQQRTPPDARVPPVTPILS